MLRFLNIALLAAAIGAGLGYLSFCKAPGEYRSTARLVIPTPIDEPSGNPSSVVSGQLPKTTDRGPRTTDHGVDQAKRELTADATLQRALDHSALLATRPAGGSAMTLEQIRQSLAIDNADEPPGVLVIQSRAPAATTAQAILTSVIDAYFVADGQRRDAREAETAQLVAQARQDIHQDPSRTAAEARLRTLIESQGTPPDDAASMERLSQQRAALILRRNAVQRQITQIERGQAMAAAEPAPVASTRPAKGAGPPPPVAGVGAQEREAALLEEDDKLALKYGPEHPKRKAIRLEIELLQKYPAEQAQLLTERSQLLQQYGANHPRLQAIQQRLDELGIAAPAPAPISAEPQPASTSTDATSASRLKTLRAALEELDAEDGALKRLVDSVSRTRELTSELRQLLDALPAAAGNVRTIDAALDRLEQVSTLQTALRPYLAMRPTPGIRSDAGMIEKIVRGAIAGLALGGLLALGILWAGRRK